MRAHMCTSKYKTFHVYQSECDIKKSHSSRKIKGINMFCFGCVCVYVYLLLRNCPSNNLGAMIRTVRPTRHCIHELQRSKEVLLHGYAVIMPITRDILWSCGGRIMQEDQAQERLYSIPDSGTFLWINLFFFSLTNLLVSILKSMPTPTFQGNKT